MASIANLTVKDDGSFEGTLATLMVTAPIAIVPNGRKVKDSEPDYRVISRKNGYELGAGWVKTSQVSQLAKPASFIMTDFGLCGACHISAGRAAVGSIPIEQQDPRCARLIDDRASGGTRMLLEPESRERFPDA